MSSSTWALVGEIDRLTNLTAEQAARIEALEAEKARLQRDCAEAYQVVGTLAGAHVDLFNDPQVVKALDNLSAAVDPISPRPHDDLLPFAPILTGDPLSVAESRADAAESALASLQDNVCASFDKWSKALGWGLIGVQPECWALMDAAVEELVSKRSALAEAVEVMRPFAGEAASYDPDEGDGQEHPWYHLFLTIGHLRAARAFVQQHEGKK